MSDDFESESGGDTIAGALEAAYEHHEGGAEPAAEPAHDVSDHDSGGTDRKEASSEARESEPERTRAPRTTEKTAAKSETTEVDDDAWSTKNKSQFSRLPPEAQRVVRDIEADYAARSRDMATLRRDYDPVNKMLQPYSEQMKAQGWTPSKLISAWANAEKGLMSGGASAEDIVAGVIKHYQVNLGNVARKLGLQPRHESGGAPQQYGDIPPHVAQQLNEIRGRLDADDRHRQSVLRREQTAAETRVMDQIDKFKSAKDDRGQLKHPHFAAVEDTMAAIAQEALAARKAIPELNKLYEEATWRHPATRESLLRQRQGTTQRQVPSRPGNVRADMSIREMLETAAGMR